MGGYGSTRWAWHTKKDTVEDCRILAVRDFDLAPDSKGGGSLVWRNGAGEKVASIGYAWRTTGAAGVLVLIYTIRPGRDDARDFRYPVQLQITRPNFGGLRWWFTCPLITGGHKCSRRVGKLYLPPGGLYFGCRHCYDLSYRSRQEWDSRVATLLRRYTPDEIGDMMETGAIDVFTGIKAMMKILD
jgi:hypothetical protein